MRFRELGVITKCIITTHIDILSLQKDITSKDKKSTTKESLTYTWQQKLNLWMYITITPKQNTTSDFKYGIYYRDFGASNFQNLSFRRSFAMYENNNFRTPTGVTKLFPVILLRIH